MQELNLIVFGVCEPVERVYERQRKSQKSQKKGIIFINLGNMSDWGLAYVQDYKIMRVFLL